MRSLFVLGDSISIHYGPALERMVEGCLSYSRKGSEDGELAKALANLDMPDGANGGDSARVLAYLRLRCADPAFRPDVLLLNCGLHDIKRAQPEGRLQVPLADYIANLEAALALLRGRGLATVWVRTTPVADAIHNQRSTAFHRHADDVAAYNAAADRVMATAGVRSIDLHRFTTGLGGDEVFCDHVHFTEPVRRLQAAFIAGHLLATPP